MNLTMSDFLTLGLVSAGVERTQAEEWTRYGSTSQPVEQPDLVPVSQDVAEHADQILEAHGCEIEVSVR